MPEFVDGLFVDKPSDKAPDFVKAKLSFKADKFIPYLESKANAKGYVNIDVLESKDGKYYAKLNDYQRQSGDELNEQENAPTHVEVEEVDEGIPELKDDEELKPDDLPW